LRHRRTQPAYTLLEVLVTIAIVTVLIGMLLPALQGARASVRGLQCQMSQRTVAADFIIFANDYQMHAGQRGDDARELPAGKFRLETFQESQYQIDEFWGWGSRQTVSMPFEGNDPMRCPEVPGNVQLRRGAPCSRGGVSPPEHISFGFNVRLHVAEVERDGRTRIVAVHLTSQILEHGDVPLFWDVDGAKAEANGVSPVFSGPSLDSGGPFARDRYWFPDFRHNGAANFAFIDGRVEATRAPLSEPWPWGYQPVR